MPIAPETRWLYPISWRELSQLIRLGRAQGRCERCGRPHGAEVTHLGDGTWWDAGHERWRDGRGLPAPEVMEATQPWLAGLVPARRPPTTRVVLSSAHLDHDPGNNRARNLTALCQRCHMLHDAAHHRRTRWGKRFARRARLGTCCGSLARVGPLGPEALKA